MPKAYAFAFYHIVRVYACKTLRPTSPPFLPKANMPLNTPHSTTKENTHPNFVMVASHTFPAMGLQIIDYCSNVKLPHHKISINISMHSYPPLIYFAARNHFTQQKTSSIFAKSRDNKSTPFPFGLPRSFDPFTRHASPYRP